MTPKWFVAYLAGLIAFIALGQVAKQGRKDRANLDRANLELLEANLELLEIINAPSSQPLPPLPQPPPAEPVPPNANIGAVYRVDLMKAAPFGTPVERRTACYDTDEEADAALAWAATWEGGEWYPLSRYEKHIPYRMVCYTSERLVPAWERTVPR